jgi:antiviral defense system Shedu protein SduA
MQNWHGLLQQNSGDLTLGDPRCLLIAGNAEEEFMGDNGPTMRDDFELLRERTQGLTIVTYDELFRKLDRLVALFEQN